MYTVRTDLALERHARLGQVPPSLPGLAIEHTCIENIEVTDITLSSPEAAAALNKPEGRYITLDLPPDWQTEISPKLPLVPPPGLPCMSC